MRPCIAKRRKKRPRLPLPDDKYTRELFRKWRQKGEKHLREEIIRLYEPLVNYFAFKFAGRGEPVEDLRQVGMVGLINAVDRFDPERGVKFTTYATPTILGEIKRHFRDKGWMMKVPRRLQELCLEAARATDELTSKLGRPPTIPEIAERMRVTEEKVIEALEACHAYELPSLEAAVTPRGGEAGMEEQLGELDKVLESVVNREMIRQALEQLSKRERQIIVMRFWQDMPQSQVAERLGISQMHVSRLQRKALQRLREILEGRVSVGGEHKGEG